VSQLPFTFKAEGISNAMSKVYQTHNNFGGWNLIPNIYPVTISTETMYDDGFFDTIYDKAVWIWNPNDNYVNPFQGFFDKGAYVAIDAELNITIDPALFQIPPRIAPFQSFYVRRTSASDVRRLDVDGTNNAGVNPAVAVGSINDPALLGPGSFKPITMKPDYRTSCEITPHYKRGADVVLVTVSDKVNKTADMLSVAFASRYTNLLDRTYDIRKQANTNTTAPIIYTVAENEALVINKMAPPVTTTRVPMGFIAPYNNREYAVDMVEAPTGWVVYLEDKMTGEWHDLTTGSYDFRNNTVYKMDRFVLHFAKERGTIEPNNPDITAWGTREGIEVNFRNIISEKAEIIVSNMVGQIVYHNDHVFTRVNHLIPLRNFEPQMFTVTIITDGITEVHKVVR
jgi:hypothetical protein